ncbi:hypothetical protein [Synoicihabitans lomoniglobus]|uniref:Uncharacterized protein n=1 Tax=Synoicihabitans lomoniglobus TaxID=2909285 RepID=A0AAF0CN86_9BACT|nr:hypothetical protein [Opitutaceae bacterium LMO-M01]WED64281.1 hypothetical protein PXH66_18240 [Opitutaceae bacterium LMO-M01]
MQPRPSTLAEVADRASSLEHFGRELADWLHTVRGLGSRPALGQTIAERPRLLARKFPEGALADATLAAYADYLAERIRIAPPRWCFEPERISPDPWFGVDGPRSRRFALRDSPPAFKRRNLFTPNPDLPVRLRRGRPPVSLETKRANNRARQRRFQLRRKALLSDLLQRAIPNDEST